MKAILIVSFILTGCIKMYYISNETGKNQSATLRFNKVSSVAGDSRQFSRYSKNKIIHNLEVAENDSSKGYKFELAPRRKINLFALINTGGTQTDHRFQLCLAGKCEDLSYPIQSQQPVLKKSFLWWQVYEFRIKD